MMCIPIEWEQHRQLCVPKNDLLVSFAFLPVLLRGHSFLIILLFLRAFHLNLLTMVFRSFPLAQEKEFHGIVCPLSFSSS